MRKIQKNILIGTLLLLCFQTNTVFAETENQSRTLNMDNKASSFLSEGASYSADVQYGDTRGSIISTALVSITDKGKGTILISVDTLAHESCDSIKQIVILECWNDKNNNWDVVKNYELIEVIEDQPDGRLAYLMNEITLSGQKIGSSYRVRSTHSVTINGKSETLRAETGTIKLGK